MIRVYLLPVLCIQGVDTVVAIEIIHDALLECTANPDVRKLVMDTTPDEHESLVSSGAVPSEATQEDFDAYHALVVTAPPDPDAERYYALLTMSPPSITLPEVWELLRIIGHRFGWY